ncbi:MAG: universal stress protein [Planctomycetota bacterium]
MRILSATDHSEASKQALGYLRKLPCCQSVDLSLVEVVQPMPLYDFSGAGDAIVIPDLISEQTEATEAMLAKTSEAITGEFQSVETHCSVGPPGAEIVRIAKEQEVELITLGAVGHSALARVFLGSVSDYVATHAESSVLVVRPPTADQPLKSPEKVLIAIGNAANDKELFQWVERLELPATTEIHLVHVMETLMFYRQDLLHRASEYWKEVRSAAAKHIEKLEPTLQGRGFTTQSALIEAAHIGERLIDYAKENDCQLIITGDSRDSFLDRLILGSTSRHVLRHAPQSVLIAR